MDTVLFDSGDRMPIWGSAPRRLIWNSGHAANVITPLPGEELGF